jgi:hypothetical protein
MKRNFKNLIQETRPRTCGRMVLKLKKKQTKSENHEICQDVMISYVEAVIKKLRRFRTSCHVRCLQNEASPKKIHRVEKDPVRFGIKLTVELGFNFKTFSLGNRQHRLFRVKFW